MTSQTRTAYRVFSLGLAVIFVSVGGVFLILPREMIAFFNGISRSLGMVEAPSAGPSFFGVLAVAYMTVVTILAWRMYRSPTEKLYPLLLGQAKIASALLSFLMFAFHAPWLVYLVNGIVDGGLGLVVLLMFFKVRAAAGRGVR